MANAPVSPVVLVILDGWGYRQEANANAIAAANTPNVDAFFATYPSTLIHTSGKRVGLPDGQMGNSEVGHLNLGAGRVVPRNWCVFPMPLKTVPSSAMTSSLKFAEKPAKPEKNYTLSVFAQMVVSTPISIISSVC